MKTQTNAYPGFQRGDIVAWQGEIFSEDGKPMSRIELSIGKFRKAKDERFSYVMQINNGGKEHVRVIRTALLFRHRGSK